MRGLSFFLSLTVSFICTLASDNVQLWPDEPSYGTPIATASLLTNVAFANSFNSPVEVQYTPPNVDFNRVALELSVSTSAGSNYDRLGMAFLNGVEIWRTSTSEPANDNTYWDYSKDVSEYISLFKDPGQFGFLLNNVVDSQFTGTFEVTVVAKFYQSSAGPTTDGSWAMSLDAPANNIQTFKKDSKCNYWSAPSDNIEVQVPQQNNDVNRALLQIFASGNNDDEFWWDTLDGHGTSRFVNAFINEQPAGFASPFPVIYTGGVNPSLWKPLVGIRAYDVPSYFIDVTPFLPSLWSGVSTLKVNVSTGIDNNPIPSNWIVNVNLFTWSTQGQANSGSMDSPSDSVNVLVNSPSGNPHQVSLTRNYSSSATLVIGGQTKKVGWTQDAAFDNTITYQGKDSSIVVQHQTGSNSISGSADVSQNYNFPLTVQMSPQFYRVQQTYDSSSPVSIYTWIDSTVNCDSGGSASETSSSQYLSGPGGNHFKKTENGGVTESW